MKTFECIAKSGNTGKEIVILIRAVEGADHEFSGMIDELVSLIELV